MAKPTKLGMIFEGAEAEEFLQNESSSVFTSEQLDLFKKAKRITEPTETSFDDRNSGKGTQHSVAQLLV